MDFDMGKNTTVSCGSGAAYHPNEPIVCYQEFGIQLGVLNLGWYCELPGDDKHTWHQCVMKGEYSTYIIKWKEQKRKK
jgi:hypothetical protein